MRSIILLSLNVCFFVCGLKQVQANWVDGESDTPKQIATQIAKFSKGEGVQLSGQDAKSPELIEESNKSYYGIHEKNISEIDYPSFKTQLVTRMGLKTFKMVQIIGSSNQFSETGTNLARAFLTPYLEGNHLIEYGYTGHVTGEQVKLDINSLVNEYIEKYPEQAHRVLANVVGHSVIALEKWGCKVSNNVSHFVTVFNDAGMSNGFTKFGDDVIASDFIMSEKDNDLLVMVEGGAQSFKQAVNALKKDIPIVALGNVREEKDKRFFSTTEFFFYVKEALSKNADLTSHEVNTILETYLSTHEAWDKTRPDADTKEKLFYSTVQDFIRDGFYKKLSNKITIQLADM